MKRTLALAAAALVGAALLGSAVARAADPLSAVKADIAKLEADAQSAHDALVADAQQIVSDAKAAKGGSKEQAKATIKADLEKLRADGRAAHGALAPDRAQLRTDLKAAKDGGVAKDQIKPLLQDLHSTLKQERAEVRSALAKASQAVRDLRESFRK